MPVCRSDVGLAMQKLEIGNNAQQQQNVERLPLTQLARLLKTGIKSKGRN